MPPLAVRSNPPCGRPLIYAKNATGATPLPRKLWLMPGRSSRKPCAKNARRVMSVRVTLVYAVRALWQRMALFKPPELGLSTPFRLSLARDHAREGFPAIALAMMQALPFFELTISKAQDGKPLTRRVN